MEAERVLKQGRRNKWRKEFSDDAEWRERVLGCLFNDIGKTGKRQVVIAPRDRFELEQSEIRGSPTNRFHIDAVHPRILILDLLPDIPTIGLVTSRSAITKTSGSYSPIKIISNNTLFLDYHLNKSISPDFTKKHSCIPITNI